MKKSVLLSTYLLLVACLTTVDLTAAVMPYFIKNAAEIYALNSQTMVDVDWAGKWRFCEKLPANWQEYPADSIEFELKNNSVDLEKAAGKTYPGLSEGAVYKKFTFDRDGYAIVGIGADWWFEAACNGETFYTTFPYGNAVVPYHHTNHQFMIKVKKGENIFAVRIKRGDAQGWTFACGKVNFFLPPLPVLRTGPYLLNPSNGRMSIGFESYGNIGGGIEYRLKGSQDKWQQAWSQKKGLIQRLDTHLVHLKNLQEGAVYEYRIMLLDPISPEVTHYAENGKVYTFRVPSAADKEFSFIFTADLQFPPVKQREMIRKLFRAADAASCDYIVLGGDLFGEFDVRVLQDGILSEVSKLDCESKKSHPLIVVRGNHELRGHQAERFTDIFATADGESFGIYNIGSTALLKLDSWEDKPRLSKGALYCKYSIDDWIFNAQKEFLKENLPLPAWKNAEKRIVLAHGAPYSHRDNFKFMTYNLRDLTDEYFKGKTPQYQLTLYLAGHVHAYMRSVPNTAKLATLAPRAVPSADGVDYNFPVLTTAGPSASQPIQSAVFRVTVKPGKLEVKTFTPEGKLIEELEISDQGKVTAKQALAEQEP